MSSNNVSAVVCTTQPSLLDVIRQVLKDLGVDQVSAHTQAPSCIAELKSRHSSVLILDWGVGPSTACEILQAVRPSHKAGVRPIFLFSRAEDETMEGVALENGVLQCHFGVLSRDTIQERLKTLLNTKIFAKDICDALDACVGARHRKDYKGLRKLLLELYQKHTDDAFVCGELAEDYLRTDEVNEAMATIKPFLGEATKSPRILNIQGRCLLKMGRFKEATFFLQQADIINPYNVQRLLALGTSYLNIFKPDRAKVVFARALKLDPKNSKAKKGMGQSLLQSNDINEALTYLRQLSSDSELASVFNNAAIIAIRAGRYTDGMSLYRVACETVNRNNREILAKLSFNMGLANLRSKDYGRAQYYFTVSTKLVPDYERATQAVQSLERVVGSSTKELFSMPPDPVAALLRDDWDGGTSPIGKTPATAQDTEVTVDKDFDMVF